MKKLLGAVSAALALSGALLSLALASPAAAQTTTIGSSTSGFTGTFSKSYPSPGQNVTPPTIHPRLVSYSLWIRRFSPTLSVTPVIYEWNGATVIGPAVWTGPTSAITSTTFVETAFTPNVVLDPAKQYVLSAKLNNLTEEGNVDLGDGPGDGGYFVSFNETDLSWSSRPPYKLHFSATFGPALVAPAPVPTLSEWAMILLGVMLAGGAALYIQRSTDRLERPNPPLQ